MSLPIDVGGSGNQVNSADGGAVAVDSATLNIRGGKISNNRAGSTSDIESAANGGAVSGRNGARINMYDGEISNNFTGCVGGGVCLWYSKFNMYGGTITRNYARYGGGAGMSTKSTTYGCEIILYNDRYQVIYEKNKDGTEVFYKYNDKNQLIYKKNDRQ